MIELAQHIELLLLENDCVIIPNLGGFIAHKALASRSEDGVFLPPTRSIGFNPQLKLNDGLLIQSYMTAYDTNFSDATKRVEKAVAKLMSILHDEGKVDLDHIGEIRCTVKDAYEFIPYRDNVATPFLYGLDSFEMKELSFLCRKDKKELAPSVYKRKTSYELRINRAFVRNIVAAAAAIVFFFFLSTPVENTNIDTDNYALLFPSSLFEKMEEQSLIMNPVVIQQDQEGNRAKGGKSKFIAVKEVKVSKPVVAESSKSPASIQTQKELQPKQTNDEFHIIVASGINLKDAKAFVQHLITDGYLGAKVLENEGKVRVCIVSCSTREEATKQLLKIRENEAYKDCWMLTK